MFHYVYILLSKKDNMFYTGYTSNLENRMQDHKKGKVASTKNRRPLLLVYFESCLNQQDATRREKYLKSGNGKIYINNRIRNFLKESNGVNTHVSIKSLAKIKSPLDVILQGNYWAYRQLQNKPDKEYINNLIIHICCAA